jgi:hypothetical protein
VSHVRRTLQKVQENFPSHYNVHNGSGAYSSAIQWVRGGGALFPKLKWPERETEHSPLSRAEIKNVLSCTTISLVQGQLYWLQHKGTAQKCNASSGVRTVAGLVWHDYRDYHRPTRMCGFEIAELMLPAERQTSKCACVNFKPVQPAKLCPVWRLASRSADVFHF